jgi:formate dehydrogenase subunit gamma
MHIAHAGKAALEMGQQRRLARDATHSIGGVALIAVIFGHIYIGTLGMEGAFDAMGSGEVDVNWAKEHHSLWAEKELSKGHGTVPAE